jgi:murein DD-endopeptidase MepM/ murein hydrolase activator NlpD
MNKILLFISVVVICAFGYLLLINPNANEVVHSVESGSADSNIKVMIDLIPDKNLSSGWISPMKDGQKFGAAFGANNPAGQQDFHNGIDIYGPKEKVYAVADGTIVWNSWWPPASQATGTGHGITVVILHSNGLFTYYAHLNESTVSVGQQVIQGELIGIEGTTGFMPDKKNNKHLHFAVRNIGPENTTCWDRSCWLDPNIYLP